MQKWTDIRLINYYFTVERLIENDKRPHERWGGLTERRAGAKRERENENNADRIHIEVDRNSKEVDGVEI